MSAGLSFRRRYYRPSYLTKKEALPTQKPGLPMQKARLLGRVRWVVFHLGGLGDQGLLKGFLGLNAS